MAESSTTICERVFTEADQAAFAELSGDHNPLHVDALAARRMLFGRPVVHGVHALLWALCTLDELRCATDGLARVTVQFRLPIALNSTVSLSATRRASGALRLRLETARGLAAVVTVELAPPAGPPAGPLAAPASLAGSPVELGPEQLPEARGELPLTLDPALADRLFPSWSRHLEPTQLAQLLATTRLVGMHCPGLHSVFGELSARFRTGETDPIRYAVSAWDPRFRRATLALEASGFEAELVAFLRPIPREQVRSAELRDVRADQFAGQRALVVGGSRGLGEVCAKLLAKGGASVCVTYASGAEDAARTVADIESAGGRASALHLDVLAPASLEQLAAESDPTHLYYFASPFVFEGVAGRFSPDLFGRFCAFYVTALAELVAGLRAHSSSLVELFNPSSVAVAEATPGLAEYAAAKAAGEQLCRSLEQSHPGLRTTSARLPRLATDQTQTLLAFPSEDPVPVLLAELQRLQDA